MRVLIVGSGYVGLTTGSALAYLETCRGHYYLTGVR